MNSGIASWSALGILTAVVTTAAMALEPGKALTQYVHDVWTDRNGLPQSYVQTILQTRDGYLWIGTQEGLVRYDGQRFTVFDERNTPALVGGSSVLALAEATDGTLWLALDGALATLRRGRFGFEVVQTESESASVPRAFAMDAAGNLWVGRDGALCRPQPAPRVCYTAKDGLPSERIMALVSGGEDALWVATDTGLARFGRGRFVPADTSSGLPPGAVTALVAAADGALWVGTRAGLYRYRDGRVEGPLHGISSEVWSLLLDRAGGLWVGTNGAGVFRVRNGRAEQFSSRHGLSHDFVDAVYEDREGSVWIGTRGGGLDRLSDGKVTPYGSPEGLRGEITFSVRGDGAGNVWVGTDSGLNRIAPNGEVTAYGVEDGLTNTFIASLATDRAGDELWVGTHGGGLHRRRDGRLTPYRPVEGATAEYIWSLLADRRGRLWIGSLVGLQRLQEGRLAIYPGGRDKPGDAVQSLLESRTGDLWVGTMGGLYRLRDDRREDSPVPGHVAVTALHEDAAGTLWVGTYDRGLYRFRDGSHRRFGPREGLFDDTAYTILEDDGHLWMSSNRGIYRVAKRELEEVAAGRRQRVRPLVLGIADGMRSGECNAGGASGWKGRDGRLWFATMRGAVAVDPRRLAGNPVPPLLAIESVLADQRPLDLTAHRRLPAGVRRLEVRYTALSFRNADRVRFKHKLEGFDSDWVDDAATHRAVTYTNLAPGRYRFQVIACNGDGVWNREGAAVSFELAPPFYRAPWFLALCVLGVVGLGAGGYQLRFRYLLRRNRKLESLIAERTQELQEAVRETAVLEERNRIAQDLHDSLAQGLAGVVIQLEATRGWARDAPAPLQERLREASRTAKDCLEETRRSVQALHPPLLEGADLPRALAKLVQQLSAGEVEVELALLGTATLIPKPIEIQLLRIAQEAIANALRHAAASHIRVSLRFAAAAIELTVEDDGRGMAAAPSTQEGSPGMGLAGMRRRARRLGGELSVESHTGRGTTVRLSIPDPPSEAAREIGA